MSNLGERMKECEIDEMIMQPDVREDGVVNFDGWVAFLTSL